MKKVNLRKAGAIQKEIVNYISENPLKTEVKVPLNVASAQDEIDAAQHTLRSNVNTLLRLYDILSQIRDSVAKENVHSGISTLLGSEVKVKNEMRIWEKVKNGDDAPSSFVLVTMIDKTLNKPDSDSYYSGRSGVYDIKAGVVAESIKTEATAKIIDLKRQRNKINESILALNVKTEIEISDENYEFLEFLGII